MELHTESKSDSMAAVWKPSGHSLHLAPQNGEEIQWCQLLLTSCRTHVISKVLCLYRFLIRAACIFRNSLAHLHASAVPWLSPRTKHPWPSLEHGLNQLVSKTSTSNRDYYNVSKKVCAVLIYLSQRLLDCSHTIHGMHYSAYISVSWKLLLNVSKPRINVASQRQSANQ